MRIPQPLPYFHYYISKILRIIINEPHKILGKPSLENPDFPGIHACNFDSFHQWQLFDYLVNELQ